MEIEPEAIVNKTWYEVRINRDNLEKAIYKLIKQETGYCPEEDKGMMDYTHFYDIKLECLSFDCDEGDIEYIYTFSDDGSLRRWGE